MKGELARLPPPEAAHWDWQRFAACRDTHQAVFFGPEGERPPQREQRESEAKQICTHCPVQPQCLEHALRVAEPYGIWGGLSTGERRQHRDSRLLPPRQ